MFELIDSLTRLSDHKWGCRTSVGFSSALIMYKQPDPNLNGDDGVVCRREGIVPVDGSAGGSQSSVREDRWCPKSGCISRENSSVVRAGAQHAAHKRAPEA